MNKTLTVEGRDGQEIEVRLRKVNPNDLALIAQGQLKPDVEAKLYVHPERRTADDQKQFLEQLSDEALTEIYFAGQELNDDNLNLYYARQKKLLENSNQKDLMDSPVIQNFLEKFLEKELNKDENTTPISATESAEVASPEPN